MPMGIKGKVIALDGISQGDSHCMIELDTPHGGCRIMEIPKDEFYYFVLGNQKFLQDYLHDRDV